ncbi:MAG: hypothetical protein K8R53_15865, partial [Bacteroidales bacterium]|nr:hypothetical protein [Bacteroidales bacterium]
PRKAGKVIQQSGMDVELKDFSGEKIRIICKPEIVPELNRLLVENNIKVQTISHDHNLEEYFLNVT